MTPDAAARVARKLDLAENISHFVPHLGVENRSSASPGNRSRKLPSMDSSMRSLIRRVSVGDA